MICIEMKPRSGMIRVGLKPRTDLNCYDML